MIGPTAALSDGTQRHQRDLPAHAGDADAIVPGRADGPRHVRPVPALLARSSRSRVAVVVDEVPTVHGVNVSVEAVVLAIALQFRRIPPEVRPKVRMVDRYPD